MRMRRYRRARLLENRDRHFPSNAWEISEKLIKRISGLKIVEQVLHRHACAREYRYAPLNLRVHGNEASLHAHMIRRRVALRWLTNQANRRDDGRAVGPPRSVRVEREV